MIETLRLRLRAWHEEDGPEFVRLTNTPAVMAHLGGVREPYDWRTLVDDRRRLQSERGFCFWVVERRVDSAMLGFCGLEPGNVEPIAGEIEIGWRLREDAWGQGYAKQAAIASLIWAWANLDAPRIVAITVPANRASWGLMRRIGMSHRPELDFAHPAFPAGHPLSAHVGYAIDRPA